MGHIGVKSIRAIRLNVLEMSIFNAFFMIGVISSLILRTKYNALARIIAGNYSSYGTCYTPPVERAGQ